MRGIECAGLIQAALAPDDLVVVSLGTANRSWRAQNPAQPTYYCSDPMGLSASIALGMALAQPARRVVLISGDGELLMSLSILVTIAGAKAANLALSVFDNGRYETGGGQPMVGAPGFAWPAMACSAGLAWAAEAATLEAAESGLRELLAAQSTGLLAFKIAAEAAPYPPAGPLSQSELRALFLQRMAS